MDKDNYSRGKVLVISASESFLAKSLVSKVDAEGINVDFSKGEIRDIERQREKIELLVLFMTEDMEDLTETLVYLKDLMNDLDIRMIIVGDETEHDLAAKTIPDHLIAEWFKRPLVMDDLIKSVRKYMDRNSAENRKKTVLIVDDDITYMRTVFEWLRAKYHVGMASNGVQAITFLAKNKADLVLLDYEMPIANGPQVLEMLRSDSETGHIPVMFLTGHGDKESVLSVVGLKPADYLLKTIDREGLLAKLDEFFKKQIKM